MSLAFLLRDATSRFPNEPANCPKDRVLTYAQLDGEAKRRVLISRSSSTVPLGMIEIIRTMSRTKYFPGGSASDECGGNRT